ncbi:MAG: L-histidine N(alpha)-methyltransferase [Bryobacteraceae bacterium]
MYAPALDDEFAREVLAGLTRAGQKTLPCRYFYDDIGSALFEAITRLPEYGLSKADARILESCAGQLVEALPGNLVVAELGSGTGAKTRLVLEELGRRQMVVYYPIDVSLPPLAQCAQELAPIGDVRPLQMSYLVGMRAVAGRRARGQTLLVLFLGSTIGNFEPAAAIDFLYAIRMCLEPGDALLLGTDLVKQERLMLAAYDDPAGVTAAFNLNLLGRINRELDADFDLRQFEHHVRYNGEAQRIEMHLRSKREQTAIIRGAELILNFAPGETILTEVCHKFHPEQIRGMARAAGYRVEAQWTDRVWPFAESLLVAV